MVLFVIGVVLGGLFGFLIGAVCGNKEEEECLKPMDTMEIENTDAANE